MIDGDYHIHFGDCIEHMAELPPRQFDFAVFSPPFPSVFAYTDSMADIGNSENLERDAALHFSFFFKQIIKMVKPGRIVVVHCMQIPGLMRNGEIGTFDFRGLLIRIAKRAGFIYQYEWVVHKNPQAQAIRTHSHKLLFVTLERDRVKTCGAFGDFLIKFIVPGANAVPIDSKEISREEWIEWADPVWFVNETRTLNVSEGRGENDTKHICPLQLEVIERLVKLYSNPGEIVFSPFAGIGSEGYESLRLFRRFYGCELKAEYHAAALVNMERAIKLRAKETELPLFDMVKEIAQ